MDPLDDLPERHTSHDTEGTAEFAFMGSVKDHGYFVIQKRDRWDYGTDFQLEARDGGAMTNIRVHAQLKGSTSDANADGSVSISVRRRNLNYLLRQPDSVYVCFHEPSSRLLSRFTHDVYRQYQHSVRGWQSQSDVTVRFSTHFDDDFQQQLRNRVVARGRSSMGRRLEQLVTSPGLMTELLHQQPPLVEVPAERNAAKKLLLHLFEQGHDLTISANFERFAAVLDQEAGDLDNALLAEVNLGLNRQPFDKERVLQALEALNAAERRGAYQAGSLEYCRGNAWAILKEHDKAVHAYSRALKLLGDAGLVAVVAQCTKNLGSTFEEMGDWPKAKEHYERALTLDPDLGEAQLALANWHRRNGSEPHMGLKYLDAVTKRRGSALEMSTVQGWRLELLFDVGDFRAAFREVFSLIGMSERPKWVWPWCARQVATYGRTSLESAKHAIRFWREFLREHQSHAGAMREQFFCHSSLHAEGEDVGITFDEFRRQAELLVDQGDSYSGLIWDRVGHWAQDDGNWPDAASAYERAYELKSSRFAYCYGTSLNFLDRYREALAVLDVWLEENPTDPQGWFQVAAARAAVGEVAGSIEAYSKALDLDPGYDLAWFNLGGVYWNSGDARNARKTWREAMRRFPDHPLAAKLTSEIPEAL